MYLNDIIDEANLPKAKRREMDAPSIRERCPIHGCLGRQTYWLPPLGYDPQQREFQCPEGHAFYCIVEEPQYIVRQGVLL